MTGMLLQNDARVGWILVAAIALGYMYQGPPFRYLFSGSTLLSHAWKLTPI